MNSTMENMTNENTPMMETTMYGDFLHKDNSKECAVMGLIKNQIIVLDEELNEAKLRYADVALEEENWSAKSERKQACKILEGQIAILNKLQRDFECMLTPMPKSMAMAG